MAKEMMIILVYDTQMLQKEEDDPATAILYFHPTWVSDQQKTALCGQLMGTVHCVKSIFTIPKIVSLQSGKFYIKEYGRYLMAVGTDRNIADWLLEHRCKTMSSLISFFFQDIEIMSKHYDNTKLSAKLYQLFETYLKYLFLGGNIFAYSPSLKLPKSASNVFLEAIQILQCCQDLNYVMGGCLLYHNKVVATQLSSDITKRIVLTDPYRIKCPAEIPKFDFNLPLGVQLLQVYISNKEYFQLCEEATRNRTVFQLLNSKNIKKGQNKGKDIVLSQMKRDQSIIFTAVPEEDGDLVIKTEKKGSQNRPKFLNLKNKTSDLNFVEKKVTTPFLGQTSVCSTPMTDLSKVIHSKPMSICTWDEKNLKKIELEKIEGNYDNLKKSSSSNNLSSITSRNKMEKTKTIADPNYPVYRLDGTLVSQSYLDFTKTKTNQESSFEDFDANLIDFVKNVAPVDDLKVVENIEITKLSREHRKSLTLPLKSLSLDLGEQASPIRRHSSSALLTPLMSKLTFDCSSGFCSRETTPVTQQPLFPFPVKKLKKVKHDDNDVHKCLLFVCGQQDMVVTLLLQDEAMRNGDLLNKLWEICTENLGKLEKQLQHCLETYPNGSGQNDNEPYSYLFLDDEWDTIHRGGPWGSAELGALTYFHRDFQEARNLVEILMRCCDGVIYGYQCGKSEIFYHQTANPNAGLPTPADPMSHVPLKARRRLERDHSIILL